MPAWFQLALAAISAARELIRYYDKRSSCKKERAKKLLDFAEAVKKGNTNEIKKHLIDIDSNYSS